MESCIISAINSARASAGVEALAVDGGLTSSARSWSENMAAKGQLYHSQIRSQYGSSWKLIGENVAEDFDCEETHRLFMASEHHRDNILDARFRLVGVGAAYNADGILYVTEAFVQPTNAPAPPPSAPAPSLVPAPPAATAAPRPVAPRSPAPAPPPQPAAPPSEPPEAVPPPTSPQPSMVSESPTALPSPSPTVRPRHDERTPSSPVAYALLGGVVLAALIGIAGLWVRQR